MLVKNITHHFTQYAKQQSREYLESDTPSIITYLHDYFYTNSAINP